MQRTFELVEIIDPDVSEVIRRATLQAAQDEPWGKDTRLRVISEMEVPDSPYMEPLVLNVWYQRSPDEDWMSLTQED